MTIAGFRGLHPGGISNLADLAEDLACRLAEVATRLEVILGDVGRGAMLPVGGLLREAAEELGEHAAAMRRRSELMTDLADGSMDPLAEHGVLARLRSPGAFRIDLRRDRLDPGQLSRPTPAEVAAAFDATVPSVAEEMAGAHPGVIGALDGAPARLRYLANRLLIRAEVGRLEELIAGFNESGPLRSLPPALTSVGILWYPIAKLRHVAVDRIQNQIERYRRWLEERRQILLFDPSGDGKAVEVFGDLETAGNISVVVPGMGNDLDGYDAGLREDVAQLHEVVAGLEPASATVAWLGYDTPDGPDAALRGAAVDAAPALHQFLEGIDPLAVRHTTVIAHSYGSVVAGIAAETGLSADDLVVVGSPGTSLDTAAAARLRPGGRVWVALANDDPVAAAINPSELPPWWLPAFLGPIWFAADMSNGPEALWHGVNPAGRDFGALRISTGESSGHSDYFGAATLDNLARIVVGRYTDVVLLE